MLVTYSPDHRYLQYIMWNIVWNRKKNKMRLFSIDVVSLFKAREQHSGLFGVYRHNQGKSPSGSTFTQAHGRSDATSSNLLFLTVMCSCSKKLWAVNHQGPLTSSWAVGAEAAGTSIRIGLEAGRVHTQPSVTNNATTHTGRTHKSHDIFWAIFLSGKIALTSLFEELLNLCFACQAVLLSARGRTFTDNPW